MKNRVLVVGGLTAGLALALIALPGHSAGSQDTTEAQAKVRSLHGLATVRALPVLQEVQGPEVQIQGLAVNDDDEPLVLSEDGASWLGVETHEVTADNARSLKLPAERGVVVGKVLADSPAAKAGLKENDVITEINGQRVEGASQFRRMIREVPAGRTVQLTVWRDGRSQTISATLGQAEQGRRMWTSKAAPGTFAFRIPEMPEIPDLPEVSQFDFNGNGMFFGARPRLGIDAEDLNGQLGAYFGAPDGEGVLVREVHPGSPAEKAGVKAGDVITSVNGDRIHSIGDLREKLATKHSDKDDKGTTVKLGILRNKSELSLNAELPAPASRAKRIVTHRTNI